MPADLKSILIVQTAFPGDVILTLPVAQVLKRSNAVPAIGIVVIPGVAGLFAGNPSVDRVHVYDKHGRDKGMAGFIRQIRDIRSAGYECALIPHRSLRSALLARVAGIPRRIGFDRSSGRMLMTDLVPYAGHEHEIGRNLSLLRPLGIPVPGREAPVLLSSDDDRKTVDGFCAEFRLTERRKCVALAPGTVWSTKQWPPDRFALLSALLIRNGFRVILIGGMEDAELCRKIARLVSNGTVAVAAGLFTLLQSAELIRRCAAIVSNDSAPVHLAAAAGTPVVAIFGPTVPDFGFAPYGDRDRIVQVAGLACRPCSAHGGDTCPISTFECMLRISPQMVLQEIMSITGEVQ